MRLINIDRNWTRLVGWGCRLLRRPHLARNRAPEVGAALPVPRSATGPTPTSGTRSDG